MKLRSPLPWFYLLAASLPFDRIPSTRAFGLNLRASLVFGLVFVVTVGMNSPRFFWPRHLTIRLLWAFLIVCTLSASVSSDPIHAGFITVYTAFVFALALAIAQITPQIKLKYLLISLGASAAVASLFGLYQFVGDLAGLPLHLTGLKPAYSGQVFGFPRIQAMSLEPLYFANYLLLPISLLIGLGSLIKYSWPLGILYVTALLLTLSRGGVGALLVIGLLWTILLIRNHSFRRIGMILVVGALSIAITFSSLFTLVPALRHKASAKPALATYTDQVTNYEITNQNVDRAYTRRLAFAAFRSHPLLGVGPGNFGRYIHAHNLNYPDTQIANNELAELLAETGLIGTFIVLIFVFTIVKQALLVLRLRSLTNPLVNMGWGLLFCLLGTLVQYYSFSTLYVVPIWLTVGLLIGVTTYLQSKPVKSV